MRALPQPRSDFLPQGPQEDVSLARVRVSQLSASGGAAARDGRPSGAAAAADDGHGPGAQSQRSAEQDTQVGDAVEPEEDLPEAPEELTTVHVGQGCAER